MLHRAIFRGIRFILDERERQESRLVFCVVRSWKEDEARFVQVRGKRVIIAIKNNSY
ncbi:hypothetical protein LG58_2168 [Kosakonia radicincitans YD4]|jgi:hypothetical protein|nr:hypothetical protein LG58_2168 [Kosakonia radicincitans YD4]